MLKSALPKTLIELRITTIEPVINSHLIGLLGIISPDEKRRFWKLHLSRDYQETVESMVQKSNRAPMPAEFYYRLLYRRPFEGAEEMNVTACIQAHLDSGLQLRSGTIKDTARALRRFHKKSCELLSKGEPVQPLVDAL